MHNNYYLFKQQAEDLQPQISGYVISNVFTFRKDEIIFELQGGTKQYLVCGINSAMPYLLLKPSVGRHKSQIELFPFLSGQKIERIFIIPFDKTVYINLDNYTINAVFFGKGANVYIKDNKGGFIDSFKKNIHETVYETKGQYDFTKILRPELDKIIDAQIGISVKDFLRTNFGAINNILLDEICERCGLKETNTISQNMDMGALLFDAFQQLTEELNKRKYFIYDNKTMLKLSPFNLISLSKEDINCEEFSSLNKAWDIFVYKSTLLKTLMQTKKICLSAIMRHKKYLQRVLKQIERNKDIEKKHEEAVLKGNLLITNKIRIKPHQSKVTLKNIYSDTSKDIEIKLNPKKTVVENANIYFNKYKDIAGIKGKWDMRRQTTLSDFKDIEKLENELNRTTDINKINRIKEQLTAMHLIQDGSAKVSQVQNLLKYSFNRLVIENVWEIFIGKSGKNNDLLTFSFAHKWDIWLHAQGVPGSHVIIRIPNKNTNPPRTVIEKAAQITAWHSKAQHSGLVPVIYTYVKYVHRIRKADPGTVSVQNEKVIFVKPLNIN
jgi:predicted ribosome quality control (RQC) complex YloA/Tae2 family protein